jgi:hypothetical protein
VADKNINISENPEVRARYGKEVIMAAAEHICDGRQVPEAEPRLRGAVY